MIHHISIPATDTRHVAEVLVEILGGVLTGFGPYRDSWIAWATGHRAAAPGLTPSRAVSRRFGPRIAASSGSHGGCAAWAAPVLGVLPCVSPRSSSFRAPSGAPSSQH